MKFRKVTAAANAKSDEALIHIATFPADPEAKLFLLLSDVKFIYWLRNLTGNKRKMVAITGKHTGEVY
jgi:hypothetical protein